MNFLYFWIILFVVSYLIKRFGASIYVEEAGSIRKVSMGRLKKIFESYDSTDRLNMERMRLFALNRNNPNALNMIESVYQSVLQERAFRDAFRGQSFRYNPYENSYQQSSYEETFRHNKYDDLFGRRTQSAQSARNQKIFAGITSVEELKQKYRKLSKINHPDKGGSVAAMKKLNELYEEALQRLERQ